MAAPGTVVRRLTCHNCRQTILRSFISSIGGPAPRNPVLLPRRSFAHSKGLWNEERKSVQVRSDTEFPLNEINDDLFATSRKDDPPENKSESTQSPPDSHMPWYLRVEPPVPAQESIFSARQKIPDLPEHSPAILQPLLEQISVDLGMDDLSLLDLRTLDPPSALGANLLMIVGTARSEKHLHVSADRLCRWIRSNYNLSPYADGLLGRNELKLKLRRRAKRSRLLSAVGAKATSDGDLTEDGIRTGWICVNVGQVEGGELPKTKEQLEHESKVVGFGTHTGGSSVVVQLLTEEKRGEVGLESLWTAVVKKSQRDQASAGTDGESLFPTSTSAAPNVSAHTQHMRELNAAHSSTM